MSGAEFNLILSEGSESFRLFAIIAVALLYAAGGLAKWWRDRKASEAGERLVRDIELVEVAEIAPPGPPPIARPAPRPAARRNARKREPIVPVKIATKSARTTIETTASRQDQSWESVERGLPSAFRLSGSELRRAIVMAEILGPPVALRNDGGSRLYQ